MKNITDIASSLDDESRIQNEPYSKDRSQIRGWAIDANSKNDPTFPMRQRHKESTKNHDWQRPSLQAVTTEVLHSNERPNLTATFGTASPPSGLSGTIRRFAFKYSEGKIIHWLALLLADRVNVLEGFGSDLRKGYAPNILKERGTKAAWKHNPDAVVKKVIIGVAILTSIAIILNRKQKKLACKNN
ncbi:hypothetical protein GCM10011613_03770 [Cellvibrio zantedeschiae]|uniref:Uncharacterized protein n=1 Tax=Cellvibrio zantedeschiae TaxID=1237077 RepID=A0ABQ3ATA3_9GAMM|nr:hypothetical protein [Cellvibrio zantedeschiae]GGY63320.1 hypothetical protein GCM10011613_03770 [Cellvibrio zantedeschiae]